MTRIFIRRPTTSFIFALLLIATTVLYWRGLYGPLLLDDPFALRNLDSWRQGQQPLWMVLFGNESFLMHRTLSLASFALNIVIGGDSTFSFKLGNLLHHLLAATFVLLLVRQMFLRDTRQANAATALAMLITALWLLHPLHVSTVLYVVQRMAQIPAICCFIGMWLYMVIRGRMAAGTMGKNMGLLAIWSAVPILTFLGIQGKQNAAVLPMLCLVLELAYFGGLRTMPTALRWFYALSVVLPILVVIAGLAMGASILFASYTAYDFNMLERLMSETRALWVYIANTYAPYPPSMGIYADDFVVSRGLLSPATTLLSILGLLGVSMLAVLLRTRMPSLFAGWFVFLVGHAVESSLIPLELYYEHRNYLPSVGLLICAVVLIRSALDALKAKGVETRRIAYALAGGSLLLVTFQTGGRVHVWQRLDTILHSSIEAHPGSIHANYALLNSLVLAEKFDEIYQHLQFMVRLPDPKAQAAAVIYKMNVDCSLYRVASPEDLHAYMRTIPRTHIELSTTQAIEAFVTIAEREKGACGPVSFKMLGDELKALADGAIDQPEDSYTRYTTRQHAARMYLADRTSSKLAVEQARLSWQPSSPASYSAILIRSLLLDGQIDEAERVLAQARPRVSPHDQLDKEGVKLMQELIEKAKREASGTKAAAGPVTARP